MDLLNVCNTNSIGLFFCHFRLFGLDFDNGTIFEVGDVVEFFAVKEGEGSVIFGSEDDVFDGVVQLFGDLDMGMGTWRMN